MARRRTGWSRLTKASRDRLVAAGRTGKLNGDSLTPDQVRARIEERLYSAKSIEELLGESEVISGKGYVNKPFQVRSVEWQASDVEGGEGLPFYAACSIVTTDGTMTVLTCGARSVVQKLAIMASQGWLPAWVKLTSARTASGSGRKASIWTAVGSFR